jgi:hypothetical protein
MSDQLATSIMPSDWEFPDQRRRVVLIAADLKWRELAQKTSECRDRQHGVRFSCVD